LKLALGRVIRVGLENRGYSREQQARELLARYSGGSKVDVRYDPQNPAMAVLELGQIGGGSNLLAGFLLMLVGIGAGVFTVFSTVTPSVDTLDGFLRENDGPLPGRKRVDAAAVAEDRSGLGGRIAGDRRHEAGGSGEMSVCQWS
jgi:hypothetical protein